MQALRNISLSLSMEALSRGISVYFTTLMRMVEDLKKGIGKSIFDETDEGIFISKAARDR